jgi:dihydrofolate reductase
MNKPFNVILAATPAGEIGYKNTIPWNLEGDLTRFKRLTMGNIVIMGRNTFESIGKPLIGRTVIVVSSTLKEDPAKDYHVASDLASAIRKAREFDGEIFIAGGVGLYEAALKFPCSIHLTTVYKQAPNGYDAVISNFDITAFEYEFPPIPVFYTNEKTGVEEISHTYAKLRSRVMGALA